MKVIEYSDFKELNKVANKLGKTVLATNNSFSFRIFENGKTKELHIHKINL